MGILKSMIIIVGTFKTKLIHAVEVVLVADRVSLHALQNLDFPNHVPIALHNILSALRITVCLLVWLIHS